MNTLRAMKSRLRFRGLALLLTVSGAWNKYAGYDGMAGRKKK